MNKRIETVLNNKEAKASDYFELVNVFCQSTIFLQNGDKRTVVSMEVNEFREVKGGFEFSQKCSDTNFTIDEKRIKSVSGKMQEGTDMFFMTVEMVDDTTLYICIFHTDTNVKTEVYRNYKETDVLYLKEYFNDKKYTPKNLLIKDMFGFTTEFDAIDKISLIEEEEDSKYTIQILNKGVVSVIQKCRNGICHPVCEGKSNRMTTYKFIKSLKHLVKSGIFCNLSWEYKTQSESIILESDALDSYCGTYLEVEITPVGNATMQQITQELSKTILTI